MKKAFTLIELLVTIAIIGILATILLVSFTNSKAKSRDSQRKADVQAMAAALDLYNADTNKYRVGHAFSYQDTKWSTLASTLKPYLDSLPKDPINNMDGTNIYDKPFWYPTNYPNQYAYAVFNFPTCPCCDGGVLNTSSYPNTAGYCITANLETPNGNGDEYMNGAKQCGIYLNTGNTRKKYLYIMERHYYVPDTCPINPVCPNSSKSCG